MKKTIALASVLALLAGSAMAGSPVTLMDKLNQYSATVDSGNNLHVAETTLESYVGSTSLPGVGSVNYQLGVITTDIQGPTPAGTNVIGKIGIDQTTPGTTNGVQDAATGAGAGAITSTSPAVLAAANTGAARTALIQGGATVAINAITATTTQLVALSGTTKIYVTHVHVVTAGAGGFSLVYGTGAACATGTTYLDGASGNTMAFSANGGYSAGVGLGPVYVVPAGNALCMVTSASVNYSGSLTYTQF